MLRQKILYSEGMCVQVVHVYIFFAVWRVAIDLHVMWHTVSVVSMKTRTCVGVVNCVTVKLCVKACKLGSYYPHM